MIGMKGNLKHVLEIAETGQNPKTKLQARAIANDCYKYIMDLTTNGAIVTDAVKYVTQKVEQMNTLQKLRRENRDNGRGRRRRRKGRRDNYYYKRYLLTVV